MWSTCIRVNTRDLVGAAMQLTHVQLMTQLTSTVRSVVATVILGPSWVPTPVCVATMFFNNGGLEPRQGESAALLWFVWKQNRITTWNLFIPIENNKISIKIWTFACQSWMPFRVCATSSSNLKSDLQHPQQRNPNSKNLLVPHPVPVLQALKVRSGPMSKCVFILMSMLKPQCCFGQETISRSEFNRNASNTSFMCYSTIKAVDWVFPHTYIA